MKKKLHYAWIILIACALLQAVSTGIYGNCIGIYTSEILKEFGFSNGAYAWSTTIRSLAGAASMMICSKLYNKNTYRRLYLIFGSVASICFACQIFMNQLWQFYLLNLFIGFAMGFVMTIPLITLIQNWFIDRQGFALGVAMTTSGVMGMVMNPISSFVITNYGWRYGIVMLAIISFVVMMPTVFLLVKWDPFDYGMEPYRDGNNSNAITSIEGKDASKAAVFMAILFVVFVSANTQYVNSISVFVNSIGLSITTAGLIISCTMAGNMSGKLIIGVLNDIIGTFNVLMLAQFSVAVGFIIFSFVKSPILLMVGGFLYGLCFSAASLSSGLLTNLVCSKKNKSIIVGKMSSSGSVSAALIYILISYSFDIFHSFKPGFLFAAVLCVCSVFILFLIKKELKQGE